MLPTEIKHLIQQYKNNPIESVAFKRFENNIDVSFLLQQLQGRKIVATKIPSWDAFLDDLVFPTHLAFEQASSENTASYKTSLLNVQSLVDLTGGLGIDSYFFSKHVEKLIYIEQQAALSTIAGHNFKVLGAHNVEVINTTAEEYVSSMSIVDCVYIDPARRNKQGKKVVALEDCSPNVTDIIDKVASKTKYILLKLSPMFDVDMALKSVPYIKEVHIVAVDNDCKELLLLLDTTQASTCSYHCVNIREKNTNQLHIYTKEQESSVLPITYTSVIGSYLYEPNVAILKAGCYASIASKFSLQKLHTNSHLFTANDLCTDFPGRIFEVVKIVDFNKNAIKTEIMPLKKANITVRNFPIQVDELRKKTKLKEGGDTYLFATTLANQTKVCIICHKC
jgi:hypothetical protein